MIIIADSGSTKADWAVVDETGIPRVIVTMGFNPVYHTEELIYEKVYNAFDGNIELERVSNIYYYGTGCWDAEKKSTISKALARIFPQSDILVEHDLLGAARAACGKHAGIACILGTGSNSCLFDGYNITDNVTNLGYFIGDEGSGSHLGKELVRAYFYRELPADLIRQFEERYPGGKAAILENVYQKDTPNVYLAKFTRFLSEHKDNIFIQRLVYKSFSEFIDRHVRKYKSHLSLPVSFIGSVAYHFKEFLEIILEERSMVLGNFVRKPIDSLVDFHKDDHT